MSNRRVWATGVMVLGALAVSGGLAATAFADSGDHRPPCCKQVPTTSGPAPTGINTLTPAPFPAP